MKLNMLLALLLSIPAIAYASDRWSGQLHDGSRIDIDSSNRATRYGNSGEKQLWNGVHRMDDGSVVIIKEGVVISRPQQSSISPVQKPEASDAQLVSPCVELSIKVCGFNGQCRDNESCEPARQLVKLEPQENWQNKGSGPNSTTEQCRQALVNEDYFKPCNAAPDSDTPTPCQQLVTHVCGMDNECGDSSACSPAKQLLDIERDERSANRYPHRMTPTSKQCLEAVINTEYFKSSAGTKKSLTPDPGSAA
ncbi:hypothetical protein [Solemya velesiana gill symbiont]|uniref:Dickkopf N-terminal cysteine-rich domain-containing protein n=1 Tax=Solemya velesiana gill symbiont TaxID=1918948 RepID=A0A1T2KW58_9GAMM|nr:hypothetical protein [Solemya velesiana gill symbiont]OOZ37052.1 hypothetical protein BOW51_04395 [Solemya velesiana gill symbiont]